MYGKVLVLFSLFFSFWFILSRFWITCSLPKILLVFVMTGMTFSISVMRPMFVVMVMMMTMVFLVPAHMAGDHHRLAVLPVHLAAQARPEVCLGMINQAGGMTRILPTGGKRWVIMNVLARFLSGKVTVQFIKSVC